MFFCRLLYVKWPFPTTQRQKVRKRISCRVSLLTRKNDKLNEQVKSLQRMVWQLQKQITRTSKARKKSAREAAPDGKSQDVATPVKDQHEGQQEPEKGMFMWNMPLGITWQQNTTETCMLGEWPT